MIKSIQHLGKNESGKRRPDATLHCGCSGKKRHRIPNVASFADPRIIVLCKSQETVSFPTRKLQTSLLDRFGRRIAWVFWDPKHGPLIVRLRGAAEHSPKKPIIRTCLSRMCARDGV